MTAIDTRTTVGQLVADRPGRSRVFERLGIDYCCGGKTPLEQVCRQKGLDPRAVAEALTADDEPGNEEPRDWTKAPLADLADHIVATHHAYLRRELPRLSAMTEKVARVHGERQRELPRVAGVFGAFRAELEQHMFKEERILFPMIRGLESADAQPCFHCGSVANPIAVMESEHDAAGDALAQMRELTAGYQAPADACNTYRAMLDALRELELDMHRHVHKENSILFPRAIAAEAALARQG